MPDYKLLYLRLFNAVSDAVAALQNADYGTAQELLVQAQQETEEIYISAEE